MSPRLATADLAARVFHPTLRPSMYSPQVSAQLPGDDEMGCTHPCRVGLYLIPVSLDARKLHFNKNDEQVQYRGVLLGDLKGS